MSDDYTWHDPFADDEEALERERRRAEREARRRGEKQSIGEKVEAERAAAPPPPPPGGEGRPAPPPGEGPGDRGESAPSDATPAREAPPGRATGRPAERAAAAPPTGDIGDLAPSRPARPPTAEHRIERPPTAEHGREPPEAYAAPPSARSRAAGMASRGMARASRGLPPRPHDTGPRALLVRRIIGITLLVVLVGIVGFGVKKVLDQISGDDDVFQAPVEAVKVEDVTVPEGLDRTQIAKVAKKAGLAGNYVKQTKKAPKGFDLAKYDAGDASSLEGFLFPATYEVERDSKVRDLIDRQLAAFEDNFDQINLSKAKSKNLTAYDIVIIASMIEREIQVPEERKLAAAVIYNRLKAGTPLGIDATIRFEDGNYTEPLTESRLADPTPYNTRVNPGLPPGPIGNPGLASLEAAAKPANSDVFFFVVKPGTCGEHTFVETEAEFAEAEAEYQAALEAEGGSPVDC